MAFDVIISLLATPAILESEVIHGYRNITLFRLVSESQFSFDTSVSSHGVVLRRPKKKKKTKKKNSFCCEKILLTHETSTL